ncbi:MAG: tetratricopeptide repeat protein [Nitrospirae bacterium]|nr:tetratricopeptide repeat protein [Nitrospirota bacterium]
MQLLNEKRLDDALKAFEEAMVQEPQNPLPPYYAGLAYQMKGDLRNALTLLNRALNIESGMPLALLRIGIILEEMGRLEMAADAYRALVAREEEIPQVLEARERLKRITATLHHRKAGRLFQERRYEESLKELEAVTSLTPENAEAHYATGMTYQRLGRLREAIAAYKKATEIDPGNINAHMQLAMTYETVAAYDDAIASYRKVISLAPGLPQAKEAEERIKENEKRMETRGHFEAAADFIRKEQWSEALVETKAILSIEPKNPSALFNLGLIHHNLKEEDAAIEALNQAVEADPKLQKGYYQIAVIYDDRGQFEEAIKTYEQVVAINDKGEEADKARKRIEILRGLVETEEKVLGAKEFLKKNDIAGAIREVEGLISLKKEDPNLFLTLAILYQKAGRPLDAAPVMEKAVILSPKDPKLRYYLARLYEGLQESKKAIEVYKALASLEKETPMGKEAQAKVETLSLKLHFEQAKESLLAGDYEASLQEMKAILEISPDAPVALFNSAVLYDRLNRTDEAEAFLRKTIALAPGYVQAHLQLGLVLEKLRRFKEAREVYERVIGMQGEGKESDIARSRLLSLKEYEDLTMHIQEGINFMEKGEWERARREIESIIAANPGNYIGYYYMGIILDHTDIVDEAKAAYKKAIEINPKFTQAYIRLGDLLSRKIELEEARKYYQIVIDIGKDTPDAEVAAERLKSFKAWGGSLAVTHGFNSNIAFRAKAQSAANSSYALSMSYLLLRRKDWNLVAGLSASESIYYKTQLQGNGYTLQMNGVRQFPQDRSISGSASYSKSFFEGKPTFVNSKISGVASTEPRSIPTSASLSYNASWGRSYVNKVSNAEQHNLTLSLSQKLSVRDSVSGSYSFSVYKNLDVIGSNYANRTNALSVGYSRPLVPHLGLSLGYSISLVNYSNPDSTSLFQRFRRNVNQSYSGGLSLSFTERVTLSLNYNFAYAFSRTNLPPLSAEEQQKLEDLLASPIPTVGGGGGYYQHNMGISLSTTF